MVEERKYDVTEPAARKRECLDSSTVVLRFAITLLTDYRNPFRRCEPENHTEKFIRKAEDGPFPSVRDFDCERFVLRR